MFENYIAKRPSSRRPWRTIILSVSAIGHAGFAAALLIVGMWQVDKLTLPKQQPVLVSSLPPPHTQLSEPPSNRIKIPPHRKTTSSQPIRERVQSDQQSAEESDVELGVPNTEEYGEQGDTGGQGRSGSGRGSLDMNDDSPHVPMLPAPKSPPPPQPIDIPAHALDGTRVSGNAQIQPPAPVLMAMSRDGTHRLQGTIKICIDRRGQVSSVDILDSTGHESYDSKLLNEMRSWRYRPYQANGEAIPVCSSITFIYVLKD